MTATMNRPTQLEAVREIMLATTEATEPMSLAAIAQATALKTGKPASEAAVSARIRDLRKPQFGGFKVLRERTNNGQYLYWLVKPRANDEVGTPEGTVTADTLPRNPIVFGIDKGKRVEVSTLDENGQPVAGSRAALAFAETLKP